MTNHLTSFYDHLPLFPRLNMTAIEGSSSILIRYFVQTIFISVDIAVREGALFSDLFCDMKPPFPGQVILGS